MTARLIGRIAGQPWLMEAAALETILAIAAREPIDPATLAQWKDHAAPSRDALSARPAADLPGTRAAKIRDGVAILQVGGPIFRYANMFTEMSGATALSTLSQDLTVALTDTRVRAIMLEIDSPGGEVTGMAEAAAAIRGAAAQKPLCAFVEGQACSAAYQLAAAASEIVVAPTAVVGCLGVVTAFTDRTAADEKAGIRRYEIVSTQTPGKRPNPATDTGRAAWQALADRLADEFLGDVAASRGMTVAALLAATNDGGLVVGADAVAAGLADRIGGFEETLARLTAGASPVRPTAHRAQQEPPIMADPVQQPIATASADTDTPVAEDVAPAPPPAPPAPPVADPVAAERTRAAAIQAAAGPEFAALAGLAIAQGWSPETFAQAQAASAMAVATARQTAQTDAFRASLPTPVAGGGGAQDISTLPPAERAEAEWAANAGVRSEFGTLARYQAFCAAEASGRVRVLKK
jgi:ClpP class serine protease